METLKVILHTHGGDKCVKNVVNYPIGKDQLLKKGFGIDPNNSNNAVFQFKAVARFFNNQEKTPVFHIMLSFTDKTAPTAQTAMNLALEILQPITDEHLTALGTHYKPRSGGSYHVHAAVSPTSIYDGTMLHADNNTNFAIAKRMANITHEPVQLIVKSEDGTEWKCPTIFMPDSNEE